jgi:hypothetical protein
MKSSKLEYFYREIIHFCNNLYLGDWWIDNTSLLKGQVKDVKHSFLIDIYSDLEITIDGYLLYQFTEKNDMSEAWVAISSIDKKAEIIIEDDSYPDKIREDLNNLIPKITEMMNIISEFIEDLKE